jgi:hypothetical protein
MAGAERLTLYRTAIQTGLRSNELRSLTRGNLYLDPAQPYVTCKAGSTKNRKDARQYIQPELATELQMLIATKAPGASAFSLPHETNIARMLRGDLSAARKAWLAEAKGNPEERVRREQSDFLVDKNHEGELIDFHCLRHTCGAWLSMTGAHPKTVQQVMRHSTITLTMDTYGHLFPGQEADAVSRLGPLMSGPPAALEATGTDDLVPDANIGAQRQAQQLGRECVLSDAQECAGVDKEDGQHRCPKPLQIADLGDSMQEVATLFASSGGGTRTPDTRIMIPLL